MNMTFWGLLLGKKKRSSYSKGMAVERKVKSKLESKGWFVRRTKGSRGPYDLYAMKRGKKLLVQVKSGSSSFSRAQKLRLRQEAKRKGAKALLIRYRRGRFYSKIIY
jgi:Holliday junction resolvase